MGFFGDGIPGLGAGSMGDLNYRDLDEVVSPDPGTNELKTAVPADELTALSLGIIAAMAYGGEELLRG